MFIHLIICTLMTLALGQNQSPCPEVFSYEPKSNEVNKWYGVMALKSDDDLTGVWIHVILDRPAELLGNWFGQSNSKDNIEYSIRNPEYNLEAGPPISVRFFVQYDPDQPAPVLKSIRLNGKTVCPSHKHESDSNDGEPTLHISQVRPNRPGTSSGRPSWGQNGNSGSGRRDNDNRGDSNSGDRPQSRPNSDRGRPKNNQGNGRRPTGTYNTGKNDRDVTSKPSSNNDYNSGTNANNQISNSQQSTRPTPTSTPGIIYYEDGSSDDEFFRGDFGNPLLARPSIKQTLSNSQSSQCGRVAARARPLISHGQETQPGEWPWHAALYLSKGVQLMYTCGATLISDRHVVTAAHCVTKPRTSKVVNPNFILVYLGKYNLLTFGPEVQDRRVSEIYVHADYNASVYFNDIAVLKLTRPVEITNFVRPCCLWDEGTSLEEIVHKHGIVVGWGFDENKQLSNKLMQANMPIVETVTCIYSNREFFSQFTFEKNFCAGFKNGTSVCNGDSGGGMVLPRKGTSGLDTIWQLRGIVSVGVALQGQGVCDTSQYIVFTDAAKYVQWLQQTLAK